ncbi:hypothetical protein HYX04_03775 [Candidatus Woesearchaeota archaeon]|nr:hypothetical protein [Candidatus Woesearchaeota archaeon]
MVLTIDQLTAGYEKTVQKTFDQDAISAYVSLVQDTNPIHTNPDFAVQKGLERTVVPGGLIEGTLVGIASSEFPFGAMILEKHVNFKRVLYVGKPVELKIKIERVIGRDRKIIDLSVEARSNDTVYVQGTFKAFYKPL